MDNLSNHYAVVICMVLHSSGSFLDLHRIIVQMELDSLGIDPDYSRYCKRC